MCSTLVPNDLFAVTFSDLWSALFTVLPSFSLRYQLSAPISLKNRCCQVIGRTSTRFCIVHELGSPSIVIGVASGKLC